MFITHRGRPSHVLMCFEDYQRLSGSAAGIIDLLAMPGAEDVEFDPPRCEGILHRPANLD